jgi:hypothetical protein
MDHNTGLPVRGNYPFGLYRNCGGINKRTYGIRGIEPRSVRAKPSTKDSVLTAVCGAGQENRNHAETPTATFLLGPISRRGFDPAVGLSVLEENTRCISQRVLI